MPVFRHRSPTAAGLGATLAVVARGTESGAPGRRLRSPSSWTLLDRIVIGTLCCASVAYFAIAFTISTKDPEYFSRRLISSLQRGSLDPMTTGTVVEEGGEAGASLPVPRIVRAKPLTPDDYQIVMVFGDEAILATSNELWRVKIGSVLPGLGEVTGIVASPAGGTVRAEHATLKSVAN